MPGSIGGPEWDEGGWPECVVDGLGFVTVGVFAFLAAAFFFGGFLATAFFTAGFFFAVG